MAIARPSGALSSVGSRGVASSTTALRARAAPRSLRMAANVRPVSTPQRVVTSAIGDRNSGSEADKTNQQMLVFSTAAMWLMSESSASAAEGGYSLASYSMSLGLFVMTVPGLWSLIKRAPKAKQVKRTYAVDGPAKEGATPMDDRARQIFAYFKNYNYSVVDTGEVITFEGVYQSSQGQAAALVFYTFITLICCGLVLSIVAPVGGNWWYLISLISPLAGSYYLDRGERTEQVKVKMVTSDDDMETEIILQGDPEELDRLQKELGYSEKGKIYVKGLLEK